MAGIVLRLLPPYLGLPLRICDMSRQLELVLLFVGIRVVAVSSSPLDAEGQVVCWSVLLCPGPACHVRCSRRR